MATDFLADLTGDTRAEDGDAEVGAPDRPSHEVLERVLQRVRDQLPIAG